MSTRTPGPGSRRSFEVSLLLKDADLIDHKAKALMMTGGQWIQQLVLKELTNELEKRVNDVKPRTKKGNGLFEI